MLFPLLKPFIKGDNFSDAERISMYHVSEKDFEFTEELVEADIVILTMAWNYYVEVKKTELAISFVKQCNSLNKKVITVNTGDFGVRIPYLENLIILWQGGYKSKFSKNEFVLPPFIADPLKKHYNTKTIFKSPYHLKPIIGFCGQANSSRLNAIKENFNNVLRNMKFYLGLTLQEPQQLKSTTFLRASVLNDLQKSSLVNSNFILRKKYRAGVTDNKDTHKTTKEFYDNLKNSDYVVCVRGGGNFSIRFYEALAMGRIPVFINTDCALPLEKDIAWKKHVVWVEYKDRHNVAQRVSDFHKALSEKNFLDLQLANRKLWEERLTLGGFFKEFTYNQLNLFK